jgi:hypothetical protein
MLLTLAETTVWRAEAETAASTPALRRDAERVRRVAEASVSRVCGLLRDAVEPMMLGRRRRLSKRAMPI